VEDDSAVRVMVRDDGRGFDPIGHTDGFGLLGMRERVELLQGTLEVASSPGQGTTINAAFPAGYRRGSERAMLEPRRLGAEPVTRDERPRTGRTQCRQGQGRLGRVESSADDDNARRPAR
jgi:hypothetical protein